MDITLALAGDTMLGRDVADRLAAASPRSLFSDAVRDRFMSADLAVLNLECCISTRGDPWESPGKMFHFRAPPAAAESLAWLGVDCVTLANNHALDFGPDALADTREHLAENGIEAVGAGADPQEARAAVILEARGVRVAVLGVTDHPADFAVGARHPGVAYADLLAGVPDWLARQIGELRRRADVVLVTPHWGPNMTAEPLAYVRKAAAELLAAGATLIAGHSAHVFHGVDGPVLYDLGDFIDDYAVDAGLRNDLGLMFLVTLDERGPREVTAVPLALDYCRTRPADENERVFIRERLIAASAEFGTTVEEHDGLYTLHTGVPAH
ncbi:CapA family protein [Thermomonospora umbrina]|uniref:Poly-gamma-glutamate synthesis protein (Capsule biosynthesis protein) n=1 Tax=Thermomonospora umbrina TaxID=111806 RepID=A0A3D9SS01_9ACTN|nr:CapA family protein [Thermomonospora umbrina]REE96743.1 poly-gamma-glutamate synthesis protein (capsule biosynthesis protein) [Thermomonospora umbrina]